MAEDSSVCSQHLFPRGRIHPLELANFVLNVFGESVRNSVGRTVGRYTVLGGFRARRMVGVFVILLLCYFGVRLCMPSTQSPILSASIPVTWVPFEIAHRRPWLQLNTALGLLVFPSGQLASPELDRDNEKYIAGYLLFKCEGYTSWGEDPTFAASQIKLSSGTFAVRVPYACQEHKPTELKITTPIHSESVQLDLPVSKVSRGLGPASQQYSGFRVEAKYLGFDEQPIVEVVVFPNDVAQTDIVVKWMERHCECWMSTTPQQPVRMQGEVGADGEIVVRGVIMLGMDGKAVHFEIELGGRIAPPHSLGALVS